MKYFLSPHDDDQALFGAFICIRERPTIVIVTDSQIQPDRGEVGCSAAERAMESQKANKILGCQTLRLGINDNELDAERLEHALHCLSDPDVVYAPACQGGNAHHDLVNTIALRVFGDKVRQYTTYTKTELYTEGTDAIMPTADELRLKKQALGCFDSQLRINLPHFQAVVGKSEWLYNVQASKRLHLGCGKNLLPGWVNMDRTDGADVVADVTKGIPFEDNYFTDVFSEDFLEHLPPENAVFVINEIWRVLKHGGLMRHIVPLAGSINAFGSPTHLSFWNPQTFEHFDKNSYRWAKDRGYEGFIGAFEKVSMDLLNIREEYDGRRMPQGFRVVYRAVK